MRAGARIKPAPATSTPWPISPSSAVPCCACAPLTGRTPPCHNSSSRASTPRSPLSAPLPPNPKTKDHVKGGGKGRPWGRPWGLGGGAVEVDVVEPEGRDRPVAVVG